MNDMFNQLNDKLMAKERNPLMELISERIATEHHDGRLISHSWLKGQFGIAAPKITDFKDTEEYDRERDRAQFQYMAMVEKLRDTLLFGYKMYMMNVHGEGYVIIRPDDQTTLAYKGLVSDITDGIRDAKEIMYNVREVSPEQKSKDDDLRAKMGLIEQMFKSVR